MISGVCADSLTSGLSYPSHYCKVGTCGACTLMVDGKSALACRALVTGSRISIAPAKGRPVLADLLTSDQRVRVDLDVHESE